MTKGGAKSLTHSEAPLIGTVAIDVISAKLRNRVFQQNRPQAVFHVRPLHVTLDSIEFAELTPVEQLWLKRTAALAHARQSAGDSSGIDCLLGR
jgi:hypothetical protein